MTGVKKNFLKLTLDKSHFITERRKVANVFHDTLVPFAERRIIKMRIKNSIKSVWDLRKIISSLALEDFKKRFVGA